MKFVEFPVMDFSSLDYDLLISLVALSFAPITVWLARAQLAHARDSEIGRSLGIEFQKTGELVNDNAGEVVNDNVVVAVQLTNMGIATIPKLECSIVEGVHHWELDPVYGLAPGEHTAVVRLELERISLDDVFLHVAWPVPETLGKRKGLRYQAVRMNLDQELQRWRWKPMARVFRGLDKGRRPMGVWKSFSPRSYSAKNLPGWPVGSPVGSLSWSEGVRNKLILPKKNQS